MDEKLNQIFLNAKRACKGSYPTYESYKSQIAGLGLPSKKYEEAIIKLAKILRV